MSYKDIIRELRKLSISTQTDNLLTELEAGISKESEILDWIDNNKDEYWIDHGWGRVVRVINRKDEEIVADNIRDLITKAMEAK